MGEVRLYSETIRHKQLWAWLAAAMSAPLVHFSGGSWLALLVLGVICYGVAAILPNDLRAIRHSRILCVVELAWIILVVSQMIPLSAAYWPGPKSEWIIPTVLLVLGAYSCNKKSSAVAGVLFWVLIIMYIPVAIAGVKDAELKWLIPNSMGFSLWMVPVLLLPCAAKILRNDSKGGGWYPGILLFGVGMWALTSGVLSPAVSGNMVSPFRELSQSLTIGAASRFESLIGAVVTLGWFCLSGLLIQCGSVFCEGLGVNTKLAPWLIAGAGVCLQLVKLRVSPEFATLASVLFWVVLPIAAEKILPKKTEKRA